jgi:hemolysin III
VCVPPTKVFATGVALAAEMMAMLCLVACGAAGPQALPVLSLRGGGIELIRAYTELCDLYHTRPHPSVLTALRWDITTIHATRVAGRPFRDQDLLPLADLLLLPAARHVTSLSFRGCRLRSAGAVQISRLISMLPQLESVDLTGNKLGPEAGALLAEALSRSRSIRELRLRGCRLRAAGTDALSLALAHGVLPDGATAPLKLLDLSNNQVGFRSQAGIEQVNQRRERPIDLKLSGNLVLTESLNVATHGAGLAAAVVGSVVLLRMVQHAPGALRIGILVYSASLIACYLSSTSFHSAFTLGRVRHITHIADQVSIYLLIAGSYHGLLVALFPGKPLWSFWLPLYVWALAAVGSTIEVVFHKARGDSRWIKYTSLALYIGMGWGLAFPPLLRDVRAAMSDHAFRLLFAGGLSYTLGVPFFVRNRHLDHAFWHCFVLAGSGLHYMALLHTVTDALRGTI